MGKDQNPNPSTHSPTSTPPKVATPPRRDPSPEIIWSFEEWFATRHGDNDTKAPPSMREKQRKNGDSASVPEEVYEKVHAKLEALIENSAAKLDRVKSAIDLSHWATKLPLDSTELAHFYVSLLFDYMTENEARESALDDSEGAPVHKAPRTVYGKLIALIEDSAAKQRHIKSAIGTAQWATQLDPNSTEFVRFFASLLFNYMAEVEARESALADCEIALSEESSSDESAASTPDPVVSQVQRELKSLAEEWDLATISTRMKILRDEEYNLNPIGGINEQVEYPAPRPSINNEIKKSSKILDERPKELDVFVEAALLMQQQHAEKNNVIPLKDINEQVKYRVPAEPTAPRPSIKNEIKKLSKILDEHRKETDSCVAATLLLQQQHAETNKVIEVKGINEQVENHGPTDPTASLPGINNELKKACKILEKHRKEVDVDLAAALLLQQQHAEKNKVLPIKGINEQVENCIPTGTTAPLPSSYNEIQKAFKMLKERCKDFDVCLADTLLLQQHHADPGQSLSTNSASSTALSSSPPSGFHCQKPISRKPVSIFFSNRMNQVQTYWNSMTAKRQLGLLRVSIPEMKSYYACIKEPAVLDLLSEALSFAEESGSWEFWICFKCNKKFSDAESHMNHVNAHIGMMSDLAMEAIPEEVNFDWVHMLTNTSLKPIDVASVIRSSDEVINRNCKLLMDTDSGNSDYANPVNCLEREVKEIAVVSGGYGAGGRLHKWLSDDPEREKLLEKIMSVFRLMIEDRCLSTRHVRKLLEFVNQQIEAYPLPSNVLAFCGKELERTPLGLCFLDASELQVILMHLEQLFHTGRVRRLPAKDASAGVADGATKNGVDLETIKLDIMSSTLTVEGFEKERGLRDANSLLQWMYAGPSIADRLAVWAHNMEEKSNQVMVLVKTLEKELSLCQTLCEKKLEYLETLQMLELLENLTEESGLGCEQFLQKRYNELLKRQGEELLTGSSQVQLDLIKSLFKEAYRQFNVHNSVRMQDLGPSKDDLFSDVLSGKKDSLNKELDKLDVRIMRGVTRMHLAELKLGHASLFDYRFVLIPVIKSFVQTHLEELVDEHTKDRRDAAREAFLAMQAKDKKYNWKGDPKQSNEQTKSPKGSSIDTVIHEETIEKPEVALGAIMDGILTDEALNQDEETKRMVETEAEERILLETLEYQRRLKERILQETLEYQERIKLEAKNKERDLKSQFKAAIEKFSQE